MTKQNEEDFARCSACGKIAAVQDPLTAAAMYSVLIESPQFAEQICTCEDE